MLTAYHKEALSDLHSEDALCVLGAGLGAERVLCRFLEVHCIAESLVLVINTTSHQVRRALLVCVGCAWSEWSRAA